jgi:hypothetical protein
MKFIIAVALAVAGSFAAVAVPAQAAELHHCVATIPETNVRCFETYEEAKAFLASVAETTPEKGPSPAALRAYGEAMRASTQVLAPVVIATVFLSPNYSPGPFAGTFSYVGLNGPCTTTTTDLDYAKISLPPGLDNAISSFTTGSNCWLNGFDLPNFVGASTGYHGSSPTIANGLDNRISSIKFS